MALTPLQGLTVPANSDAPAGASQMSTLANGVERQLVMRFATVAARNAALTGGTLIQGMLAYTDDLGYAQQYNGTTWVPLVIRRTLFHNQSGTASGTLGVGVEVSLSGSFVIPATPFGTGEQYLIDFYAQTVCNAAATSGGEMRLYLDGALQANGAQYNSAGSTQTMTLHCRRQLPVTTPNVTHTVEAKAFNSSSSTGLLTFFIAAHSFFQITCRRYEGI